MNTTTFSLQGKCYLGVRNAQGQPASMIFLDNAPSLKLALTSTVKEHQESMTGQRIVDDRLIVGKKCDLTLELDKWNPQNLALALYGASNVVAGGSATGEAFPPMLNAGDYVRLNNPNVSALAITDSTAGTPKTVAAADYALTSANAGVVQMINVTPYVQPFKAAYTYAGQTDINMFTQPAPEKFLLFDGINTINNAPVVVELYRVRFDPLKELDLIIDDYAKMQLTGSALYDPLNASNGVLGGFGRIRAQ